jgi:predicted nucleic acid-binding Zn ribbon protein
VTAAGFALKGSGWYATDFKGGNSKPAETRSEAPSPACGTGACPACN